MSLLRRAATPCLRSRPISTVLTCRASLIRTYAVSNDDRPEGNDTRPRVPNSSRRRSSLAYKAFQYSVYLAYRKMYATHEREEPKPKQGHATMNAPEEPTQWQKWKKLIDSVDTETRTDFIFVVSVLLSLSWGSVTRGDTAGTDTNPPSDDSSQAGRSRESRESEGGVSEQEVSDAQDKYGNDGRANDTDFEPQR